MSPMEVTSLRDDGRSEFKNKETDMNSLPKETFPSKISETKGDLSVASQYLKRAYKKEEE